ncbi:MAG TPA: hypothetical protein VJ729_01590 [Nitrososphaeraceae archaeon]|nr:hypothetical protein [Nitrososphaeraceae archaeon]
MEHTNMILERSTLPYNSVKSIMVSVRRLCNINIENVFSYRSVSEINDMCARLNTLKKKSTNAFRPFISQSTKTLCHSMGNPLKVAEDIIELEEKNDLLNSLLKLVTFLSNKYAMWASFATMTGDCQYPETSLVFDEQQDHPSSYRKEIAHMARYYRLHLGSFLAIELAKELKSFPSAYKDNRFESIIELYEIGCADYIFNFVVDINDNTREEKLVTPILMNLEDENKKVLAVHIYGDEKIRLWKRWGDGYNILHNINGNRSSIYMEVSPFFNPVAVI